MSAERALEIIQRNYSNDQDYSSLFEELADLEAETLEDELPQDYHQPLGAFLERMESLLEEEGFDTEIAGNATFSLRFELEKLIESRAPTDPLEHLFHDMMRYESGTATSGQVLTTLSRYEELLLALRHQFESSTDPTDTRELPAIMRRGLTQLEETGKLLRTELGNDTDANFEEVRQKFQQGANLLREFRRRASFVAPEPPEEDEEEEEEEE